MPYLTGFVLLVFCLILSGTQVSCKKAVELTPPSTAISRDQAYNSTASATAVLTGLYSNMFNIGFLQGSGGMSMALGLSADELVVYNKSNPLLLQLYANSLTSTNVPFWSTLYKYIYDANAAVEGINQSTGLLPKVKSQLLGEAKFTRAFLYFYAVNLFGDVPLLTSSNYETNAIASRTKTQTVYQQIAADLLDAKGLLSSNFVSQDDTTVTSNRIRPTKWAAAALLARTYLFMQKWDSASQQATEVINNSSLFTLTADLNNAFLANSSEAIWQLQSVQTSAGWATLDANNFILTRAPANSSSTPTALSLYLLNAFEPGDLRRIAWVDSIVANAVTYYYPYKYKQKGGTGGVIVATENLMLLRLSEQYLIRAEAKANTNDLAGASQDLNLIRTRAGLPNSSATSQSDILQAILHERQVELFTEQGQRWFDLKRTGSLDSVMALITPSKNTTWSAYKSLFPIPLTDIQKDPNLKQNQGYN